MGSRQIPFDEEERCDGCGAIGAYDFMGYCYCPDCIKKYLNIEVDDA